MKLLTGTAALYVGALLASQSVFGQTATYSSTPNDLLFGFQNQAGGGTEDYIINLGSASSLIDNGPVNLSSDFSLSDFDAVLGSSSSVQGGVIGAASTSMSGIPNTADVFLTQLRVGGPGVNTVPGSSVMATLSRSGDNLTFSDLSTLVSPAAGTTGVLDTSKSWESLVDPANNTGSFQSNTGLNPDSTISTSTVLYEDLWETSSSSLTGAQDYTYEGYFTLDLTGVSAGLTFTPAPEPSSYLISGLGGILMLFLRFRPGRRNA